MSVLAESPKKHFYRFVELPKVPFTWIPPGILIADAFLIICASFASYVFCHLAVNTGGDIEPSFALGMAVVFYFVPINAYRRNYSFDALSDIKRQVRETASIWTVVFLLLACIGFLIKIGPIFSRGAASVFYFAGLGGILGFRLVVAKYLLIARTGGAFAERKIVVIGNLEQLTVTHRVQDLARFGYRATTLLPLSIGPNSKLVADVVTAMSANPDIEDIVIVAGWEEVDRIDGLLSELRILPVTVRLLPGPDVAWLLAKRGVQLGSIWTKELQRPPLSLAERTIKRSLDVIMTVLASVVLLPLMVAAAGLIKADSHGPILFKQARNGFNNRTFRILKFRTLNTLEDGTNIKQVTRNDSRVTRIGALLRRTSIDELPQLWNVIRGDMSLVGPRPHATAHNSEYGQLIANYAFRHHVKPGLTGWAQINGFRGETATIELMKGRVELDLWYIDNWSIWLDLKIIAKTFAMLLIHPSGY